MRYMSSNTSNFLDKQEDIESVISLARDYCKKNAIKIEFTYELSPQDLEEISGRSKELPSLYFADRDMIINRLKNGCIVLKKEDEIIGHIFAHKHIFRKSSVYERSSLWIHPNHRKYDLGLLLMYELTARFSNSYLISIAKASKVHYNNEFLGMKRVLLSEISPTLVKELEKLGKLRDELHYKYYVNDFLEKSLRRFSKES